MAEIIVCCGVFAALVFGIQLVLCHKASKKSAKCIPVYIIIALYSVATILCLVDVFNGSGGVAIWMIFAFIISVANTVALVADMIAWVVYKKIQKNRK